MKRSFATVSILISMGLTACGIGPHQMNGVSGRERTEYLNSIKPYGAHWIKGEMTRDSRRHDFKECGGDSVSFKAAYEKQLDQTTAHYFESLNKHTLKVHACMRAKDYIYLEQCDDRCHYP